MKTSHVRVRIKVWRTTKIIGNARYKRVAIMIEKMGKLQTQLSRNIILTRKLRIRRFGWLPTICLFLFINFTLFCWRYVEMYQVNDWSLNVLLTFLMRVINVHCQKMKFNVQIWWEIFNMRCIEKKKTILTLCDRWTKSIGIFKEL